MKKPPFLDAVRAETALAREALAADLYALDAVRALISKAAGQGSDEIRLPPPAPVDLRATKAAAVLVKHLADSGFCVRWDTRVVDADGVAVALVELVVDWRAARV